MPHGTCNLALKSAQTPLEILYYAATLLPGHRYEIAPFCVSVPGDLTRIDGIETVTAQVLISEIGLDMSAWETEKRFASWLGLCLDNRISGGKVLKLGTRKVVNRAATALRMAAYTLIRSKSALGANCRRLRARLGAPKAIKAMAHKLVRLVYRMIKYGQQYVDKGMLMSRDWDFLDS